MTGVTVTTSVRSGPTNPAGPSSGKAFLVGVAERGPADRAVTVASLAQYEATFGSRTAYSGSLYDAVRVFFEEGGYEAVIGRVVGAAATVGFLSLKDRTAVTPLDTVKINALSPGSWSTRVGIAILAGTAADTVKVVVHLDGQGVEAFDNIATPADLAARLTASNYVRAVDMGAASVAPTNLPALLAVTPLSAGTDDRAAINAAKVVATANTLFGVDFGTGAVMAPGYPAATIGVGLIAHAKTFKRVALLAGSAADDEITIIGTAASLAAGVDGDHALLGWPWVTFPDGAGTRQGSPESYLAAARARAHAETGFWQIPAGDRGAARFITGTVIPVDQATNNRLSAGKVTGIATIAGKIKPYGWQALTGNAEYRLLTVRDLLNVMTADISALLEPFVFVTIDARGRVLGNVYAEIVGYLQPIADAEGVFPRTDPATGDEIDPGYSVTVDESINTLTTLASNEIRAAIAVRPSPNAESITVSIVKAALTAAV
ncbi:hypothetical protein D1871_11110 [Nakamurella silvestris]|nr:hypothetical protein D1871_11110 [Nakamurella silvestris]